MATPRKVKEAGEEAEKRMQEPPEPEPKPQHQAPEPEPSPQPEPTPKPEEMAEQVRKLQARFNTLQGKYNAEVGTVRAEMDRIREDNNRLKAELDKAKAGPPVPAERRYLKPDELDVTDEETLERTGRVARGVAEEVTGPLAKRQEELARDIERMREDTEISGFWAEVEAIAPGARALNGDPSRGIDPDPELLEWLGTRDERGIPRRSTGTAYMKARDPEAVGYFFREFMDQRKKSEVHPQPRTPAPKPAAGAPPRRGTDKRVYTREDMVRMGKRAEMLARARRLKEAREITDELAAALDEGRIAD